MNISALKPSFEDIMNGRPFYPGDVWKAYSAPYGTAHSRMIDKFGNSPRLLQAPFAAGKHKNRLFRAATITTDPDGVITAYFAHYGHYTRRDGYTIRYTPAPNGWTADDVSDRFRS